GAGAGGAEAPPAPPATGGAAAPRPPDALEAAITLAEEQDEYAGAGVLVTGSIFTVGDARLLLKRG
ncbi:hypothetical protein, partial [Streptomyces sp. NPDC046371]|uniref:hypothetical protein n=1 Tax=Streptomyces sp. NPDC046371 TaxID=3154916 RepID=UPI00340E6CF9